MGRRPPGILGLWRLILGTFDALEADFARHYHLELAELVFGPNGKVPLRRLRNLIVHLPADSAFVRVVEPHLPQTEAPWTTADYLLAIVAELIDLGNRNFAKAYSDPKKAGPDPKPIHIPRPGDDPKKSGPVDMSSPEAAAFFGGSVHYTPPDESPPED